MFGKVASLHLYRIDICADPCFKRMILMKKNYLFFSLKLSIGLGLLALLLFRADTLSETLATLSQLNLLGLIAIGAMPIPLIWASCLKWRLLLSYRGTDVSLLTLMRYYTVGYWFNNFMPSSLGGDAARSYLVGNRIGSQTESLAAVVLERLSGLATLVALAFVGYLATPSIHDDPVVWVPLGIMAAGCIFLSLLIWGPKRLLPEKLAAVTKIGKMAAKLGTVREAMQSFWIDGPVVRKTLLYSFGYHVLTILNIYVASRALGIEVGFLALCAVTPIILVLAALPTTPGSIGVWEWAYSVLLIPVGADLEQGFAIALVLRAQLLFTSLIGGALFVMDRHPTQSE